MTAEEQSKATTTLDVRAKMAARKYRDSLKENLELMDKAAATMAEDLHLESLLLPRAAFTGAPGTYARHVYNILREVTGR